MKKVRIVVSILLLAILFVLVGCQAEPVTTTVIETKTVAPSTVTVTTSLQPTTMTLTNTVTSTITSISTPTSTITSTPKTTTSASATVSQTTKLGTVTSADGKLQIGPTTIGEAFGGVMTQGIITNLSAEKLNARITCTCYDANGDVFGTGYCDVFSIKAGGQSSWKINVTVAFVGVYSYSLEVVTI